MTIDELIAEIAKPRECLLSMPPWKRNLLANSASPTVRVPRKPVSNRPNNHKEPNMTNQPELDLSKPCETVDGVPCELVARHTDGLLYWGTPFADGTKWVATWSTHMDGTPLDSRFPAVRNVAEPDPLEQLDWPAITRRVCSEAGRQLSYDQIKIIYGVVTEELNAKERTK